MQEAFVGVDASFAKRKPLPITVCRWVKGRLIPFPLRDLPFRPPRGSGNAATLESQVVRDFASKAADYIRAVAEHLELRIKRIGIDAPSSPAQPGLRRASERALDRAGISCFPTPTGSKFEQIKGRVRDHLSSGGAENHIPHANQLWMLVGFELFRQLSDIAECLEVFPQATVRALGAGGTHKSLRGAVAVQAQAVSRYTGWPSDRAQDPPLSVISWAPPHDCLDAYLSAWVAALEEDQRSPFGTPPDDVIWVPRVEDLRSAAEGVHIPEEGGRVDLRARAIDDHTRLCPACESKEFKRWPWGWDSHAAHVCGGLRSTDPEARKLEFRERFGALL